MAMDMHRYVVPWLGRSHGWEEEVYFLTAALFAYWHQGENTVVAHPPENLGASLASLAAGNPDSAPGLERRFTGLLKSHRDDLPSHLRQTVGLLKSKRIPVHWRRLWWDLRLWDNQEGRTQRSWARSFWGRQLEKETENLNGND
jgi:CRISPR type I-E-associated protein CasB/Cse2